MLLPGDSSVKKEGNIQLPHVKMQGILGAQKSSLEAE